MLSGRVSQWPATIGLWNVVSFVVLPSGSSLGIAGEGAETAHRMVGAS